MINHFLILDINSLKSFEFSLDCLNALNDTDNLIEFTYEYHRDHTNFMILQIDWTLSDGSIDSFKYDDPSHYRDQEYEIYSSGKFTIYVLMRDDLRFESYLSLGKTSFILFIIMASALMISRDATALVLQPLETIMLKVSEMAEDPFQILKFNEIEAMAEDKQVSQNKQENKVVYETMILDNAITKIGSLLLLGFGEAGTTLLSENMSKGEDLDPNSTSRKTLGIFGF